jgi:hypothetical protein
MLRKGALRGDVTGDGVADRVAVVEDPRVAFRCRFAIAVYTRGRVLLRPLGHFIDKPGDAIGQPWPLIRLLARVDRRRGAEILAAVSSGASFEQAQLLTVRDGGLERFRLPRTFAGVLSYGAIIPVGDNFDCPRRDAGEVLEAGFGALDAKGRRWRYSLLHYRIERLALRWTRTRTAVVRSGIASRAPRWWRRYYDQRAPFHHCRVAIHP